MRDKNEICLAFGKRVQELRIASDNTQKELAKAAGIHVSFLSDIERGNKAPRLDIVVNIAEALGVHISDLFRDENDKYREITELELWFKKNSDMTLSELAYRLVEIDKSKF